jgi:prophage antirepressor-like protein
MRALEKTFNGMSVRILDRNGEPWFVVADVCKALSISNPTEAIRNHEKNDLSTTEVIDSMGRKQVTNIVSEGGLYELIFKSKKEEAKIFKRWIFDGVLPSIRKTGGYKINSSLKQKSIDTRKMLTGEWHKNGVDKQWQYGKLTLAEYRFLKFKEGKRKKDLDEGELKTLLALEAMEMLSLHYNPVKGFLECEKSLAKTSEKVLKSIEGQGFVEGEDYLKLDNSKLSNQKKHGG